MQYMLIDKCEMVFQLNSLLEVVLNCCNVFLLISHICTGKHEIFPDHQLNSAAETLKDGATAAEVK